MLPEHASIYKLHEIKFQTTTVLTIKISMLNYEIWSFSSQQGGRQQN